MANISAKDVAELRKQTGIGMMECKKALVEANGDMDEAVKVLREKGLAAAGKKADRIAADGLVDTLTVGDITAIIEVNTETDFVAKGDQYKEAVKLFFLYIQFLGNFVIPVRSISVNPRRLVSGGTRATALRCNRRFKVFVFQNGVFVHSVGYPNVFNPKEFSVCNTQYLVVK